MAAKKTDPERKALEDSLKKLIKDIDNEGLGFLIEQANVLVFNKKVDELNSNLEKTNKIISPLNNEVKYPPLKITADDDKKTFLLEASGARKFMTRDEIKIMTRIAHDAEPETNLTARLYNFLAKERSDVLIDCKIKNKTSPLIKELLAYLKANYKTK